MTDQYRPTRLEDRNSQLQQSRDARAEAIQREEQKYVDAMNARYRQNREETARLSQPKEDRALQYLLGPLSKTPVRPPTTEELADLQRDGERFLQDRQSFYPHEGNAATLSEFMVTNGLLPSYDNLCTAHQWLVEHGRLVRVLENTFEKKQIIAALTELGFKEVTPEDIERIEKMGASEYQKFLEGFPTSETQKWIKARIEENATRAYRNFIANTRGAVNSQKTYQAIDAELSKRGYKVGDITIALLQELWQDLKKRGLVEEDLSGVTADWTRVRR